MAKPKVYDDATELAIEERLKELLSFRRIEWVNHGAYESVADPRPFYAEVIREGEGICVWMQIGRWHMEYAAPSVAAGKCDAKDDIASIMRGLNRSLNKMNRELRGKTTKELKESVKTP